MANLTSEQAKQLSYYFLETSKSLIDFLVKNYSELSQEERNQLISNRKAIMKYGEDILAQSTTLIMNEVSESLETINHVTADIKGTIKNLKNIQKGLNIAAAVLVLGIAILDKDPGKIGESIKGMVGVWGEE